MNWDKAKARGKRFMPLITLIFFSLVAYFLYKTLSEITIEDVTKAVKNISWIVLLGALSLGLLNYVILSCYDYIGLKFLGSPLAYRRVLPSAFISYVFNLNLGALIGGVGFRFRIYSGWNIENKIITRLIFFSTVTNWLGHIFLLSMIFCFKSQSLQKLVTIPAWAILTFGIAGLCIVTTYLILCLRKNPIRFKEHEFRPPGIRLAGTQLVLATSQWLILSSVIFVLLAGLGTDIKYEQVVFTVLVASIAGAVTHIPAGLGVIETIFLRMSFNVGKADVLAALLGYRLVYYLLPLLIALPGYLSLEVFQKKRLRIR